MKERYSGRFFDEERPESQDERRHEGERHHYDQRHHFAEPRRFEEPHWRSDMRERGHELDRDYGRGFDQQVRGVDDRWRADRDRDRWAEGQRLQGSARPRDAGEIGYGRTWMDDGRVELAPRYTGSFVPQRYDPPRRYPRGPKGYRRSDERIKEDVCDRLYHCLDLDSSDVEVKLQNGEVILSGTVPERSMKYRIESTIEDVSGVVDVTNQIRVKQPHTREWHEPQADGTPDNGRRPNATMSRS